MVDGTPVAELLERVIHDDWRDTHPFSPEMESCQKHLFDPSLSRAAKAESLREWLCSKANVCLFGRAAARLGKTSILILEERDLWKPDEYIEQLVREARLHWKREALSGGKHAFVFVAVSKSLAYARPDANLCKLATRLCELYLRRPVASNKVLRDELHLQLEPTAQGYIRWQAGVDNFAAPGDGRWWNDHRIPGGIGFVINSVGHMARTIVEQAIAINPELRKRVADLSREKLIGWALPFAMRTILTAQNESKNPGTCLSERTGERQFPGLPPDLQAYSEHQYLGWYHTDETVRAEFFQPSPERPAIEQKTLDFTYLHVRDEDDYKCMSLGEALLQALEVDFE